jgi:hypothetical protein
MRVSVENKGIIGNLAWLSLAEFIILGLKNLKSPSKQKAGQHNQREVVAHNNEVFCLKTKIRLLPHY